MHTESQENQDRSGKMPCYFIASVNIDDPSMRPIYDQYIEKVKPIVESFGGTYLVRTEKIDLPFPGTWNPDRVIVVRFDSREACDRCFASAEYKSIMGLRTESVKASAIIVEGNDRESCPSNSQIA